MSLLDRYIVRQFLVNFLILVVVLFTFVVVIDLSINLHRFIRVTDRVTDDDTSTLRRVLVTLLLVADLWWPKLLQLFNFTGGLVMVGAMGFTCSQMVRHRELVAMLAGGQSLHRIARPVLIGAAFVTVLQIANQELVLPRIAPMLGRDHNDAGSRTLGATRVPIMGDGAGRWWYADRFDAEAGTLEGVLIWETDESGIAVRRWAGERAEWGGGAWVFDPAAVVESRVSEETTVSEAGAIQTDLDPNVIRAKRYEGYASSLSFAQLSEMIHTARRLDTGESGRIDEFQRLRFGRFAVIGANVLTLVICLPFFLTRVPVPSVAQALKCAPVALIGLLGGVLGSAVPVPGVPPAVGVFIPVLILVPVAIAATSSVKT